MPATTEPPSSVYFGGKNRWGWIIRSMLSHVFGSKRVTFNRWWLISKLEKGYEGSLVRSKHHIHVSYFDILRRRDRRKVGKKWRNVRRSFEVVTEKSPFSSQTQIITVSSIKLKIYHYVWSSFASRLDFTISLYPSFEYYTLTLRRIFPREESRLEKISRKGRERKRKKERIFHLEKFPLQKRLARR